MKLNRCVYAIIGVIVLLLAGLVYAWSVSDIHTGYGIVLYRLSGGRFSGKESQPEDLCGIVRSFVLDRIPDRSDSV